MSTKPAQIHARVRVRNAEDVANRFGVQLIAGGIFVPTRDEIPVGAVIVVSFTTDAGYDVCSVLGRVVRRQVPTGKSEAPAGVSVRVFDYDGKARQILINIDAGGGALLPEANTKEDEYDARVDLGNEDSLETAADDPVIGVDLGTTHCCVGIVRGGVPQLVPIEGGHETLPSVLFLAPNGEVLVGHKAADRMVLEPSRGVYGVKRFLGRVFESHEVKAFGHFFHYGVVPLPNGAAAVRVGERTMPLEVVAAHLLNALKATASRHLGRAVRRAVVTVPAYFGETQRAAVRQAGRIAGLTIERILAEPTAAAVAYGYGRDLTATILVYDLGGGTFDASILRVEGDTVRVLAARGDPFLGGSDFDDRLTEHVLLTFEREHGVSVRNDPVAVQRVRVGVEKAKRELSEVSSTNVQIQHLATSESGSINCDYSLNRETLEQLTFDLADRTLNLVDAVMLDAQLKREQLDAVLLVGGQTRTPYIRRLLHERFDKEPSRSIHPDHAVAVGAGIVAASQHEAASARLVDIVTASIRIRTGPRSIVLVPRGTELPHETVFRAVIECKKEAKLTFLRGEYERPSDNQLVGIAAIPEQLSYIATAGGLELTLCLSVDGLVSLFVTDPFTRTKHQLDLYLQ